MTMITPPTSAPMRAMLFSMALFAGVTGCHRANQNTDTVTDSEPALSSDTGTVVGMDSDTATVGVITDNDTTTGVTTDSDTATGVTTDSDTESEAYIDICPGELDFTPCQVVTDPDRSYDICNSGVCRSPGCGERACNVPGPAFPISDTGLTLCYGYDNTPIECPGLPGSDECADIPFCGQDAQYRHDLPDRFTRITEVPDRPMVEDSLTGLTWAGLSDWRLPDVHQLHNIVDERVDDPAIDETAFPGTPADFFWTSTSDPTPPWDSSIAIGSGFTVLFEHGDIRLVSKPPIDNLDAGGDPFWSTNGLFHVRCVRGG